MNEIMQKWIAAKVVLVFLSLTLGCTSSNERAHPSQQGRKLPSTIKDNIPIIANIISTDPDHAWIIDNGANLLFTEDCGQTWIKIDGDDFDGFMQLSFIDARNGWMLNDLGKVWKTRDGGHSWVELSEIPAAAAPYPFHPERKTKEPRQLVFVDALHGWASFNLEGITTLWRTLDGGKSWEKLPMPSSFENNVTTWIDTIYFRTPLEGWLGGDVGSLYLAKTIDGGQTWTRSEITQSPSEPGAAEIEYVFFADSDNGVAAGRTTVFGTDNGGRTWKKIFGGALDKPMFMASFSFIDRMEGWGVGSVWRGHSDVPSTQDELLPALSHTADGGATWQVVTLDVKEHGLFLAKFVDHLHGWLSSNNSLYRTGDGGKTWDLTLRVASSVTAPKGK